MSQFQAVANRTGDAGGVMDGRRQDGTFFMSDKHPGATDCQASALIDCLSKHDAETVYFVGGIKARERDVYSTADGKHFPIISW